MPWCQLLRQSLVVIVQVPITRIHTWISRTCGQQLLFPSLLISLITCRLVAETERCAEGLIRGYELVLYTTQPTQRLEPVIPYT